MADFATTQDVIELFRELTPEELSRASSLLPVVSDSLRVEARNVGKDLDEMVEADRASASVVKSVTVDIVSRTLLTSTTNEPAIQTSESALGYSQSTTFLVPGGGLFIKNTELARLGLRKQRYGVIDFYGSSDQRDCC